MKIINTICFASSLFFMNCQQIKPTEIVVGKDQCDHCKMLITDIKYAVEMITEKGRVYKFDDLACADAYKTSNTDKAKNSKLYVIDFSTGKFLKASDAIFIQGGIIKSPMGGNTQVFSNKSEAQKAAAKTGAKIINRKNE